MESGNRVVSEDTQAILLLTAPLLASRMKGPAPLSLGEYNELAKLLQAGKMRPANLLDSAALDAFFAANAGKLEQDRMKALLDRGLLLSLSLEKWSSLGLWIVSRGEQGYPQRLKSRLKHLAPPILYGCGDPSLLDTKGIAIVGSRDIDQAANEWTAALAAQCAKENLTVVSGGARGVDQIAMLAAVQADGKVVGVMADSLARSSTAGNARDHIREGRLTLFSPFDPEAGFNVGNAMNRNKVIYAMADYGVVVSSSLGEGGTWSGAVEQIEKYRYVPVFVRAEDQVPPGNKKLIGMGAHEFPKLPWSNPLEPALNQIATSTPRITPMELFPSD
jgi:predicted Rossmann fold nucleotide-binding protein DprA/Smf involved in DNA uptake